MYLILVSSQSSAYNYPLSRAGFEDFRDQAFIQFPVANLIAHKAARGKWAGQSC